jgi:hypothetical protein
MRNLISTSLNVYLRSVEWAFVLRDGCSVEALSTTSM